MKPGFGNIQAVFSAGSYWTPLPVSKDMNFWGKGRSGLTIPDEYGNDATILPSCGNISATSYLKVDYPSFGAVSSGYIEIRCYYDGSIGNQMLFTSSDTVGNSKYFDTYLISGKPRVHILGTGVANGYEATNAISIGWHIVRFASIASKYVISVDGNIVAGSMYTGIDDGKWIDLVTLRDNICIGAIIKLTPYYSPNIILIDYVDFNGTSKWYITGKARFEYDIINSSGLTFIWYGEGSHIAYSSGATSYLLDSGYATYKKNGVTLPEYVPFGGNVTWIVSAGYLLFHNYEGSILYHNMAPSLIDFVTGDNFNKANSTIHIATAGMTYYDATNPYRWEINEIADSIIRTSYFNSEYNTTTWSKYITVDETLFVTRCDEIFCYSKNITDVRETQLQSYCKVSNRVFLEMGFCHGTVLGNKLYAINESVNKVAKSLDYGNTWTFFSKTFDAIPAAVFISKDGILFVNEGVNVWRSDDDGDTWVQVFTTSGGNMTGWSWAQAPGGNIFAGEYSNDVKCVYVWRSIDNGVNWTRLDGLYTFSNKHVHQVFVDFQTSRLYVTIGDNPKKCYYSDDNGDSFIEIFTTAIPDPGFTGASSNVHARYFGDDGLASGNSPSYIYKSIDDINLIKLYIPSGQYLGPWAEVVAVHNSSILFGLYSNELQGSNSACMIIRSDDNGANWTVVAKSMTGNYVFRRFVVDYRHRIPNELGYVLCECLSSTQFIRIKI